MSYCLKCNSGRKKGQWISCEMIEKEERIYKTSRGEKRFMKGKCPNCGTGIMKILGKNKQEVQENASKS